MSFSVAGVLGAMADGWACTSAGTELPTGPRLGGLVYASPGAAPCEACRKNTSHD